MGLSEEETSREKRPPIDVPEADAAEQSQTWSPEEEDATPRVPIDAPEADVLDQSRPADLDDDDREQV
ncbi:MAG: hypothetical protein M3214_03775 [Actinomycetota bacterium]|nr:hypothetical protein [Actinomycetota bacterium]